MSPDRLVTNGLPKWSKANSSAPPCTGRSPATMAAEDQCFLGAAALAQTFAARLLDPPAPGADAARLVKAPSGVGLEDVPPPPRRSW